MDGEGEGVEGVWECGIRVKGRKKGLVLCVCRM